MSRGKAIRLVRYLATRLSWVSRPDTLKRALALVFFYVFRRREARRRIEKFVFPRESRPLSESEFGRAKAMCSRIRELIGDRRRYMEINRLDPGVWLPAANWAGNWEKSALYRSTAAVLREEYDIINNLRLFSQVFTGYSLIEMRRAAGIMPPEVVPPDLDRLLLPASRRLDVWIGHYWMLAQHLPDSLRIAQPCRFGETGWLLDGGIVNHDAYAYQERIALLHASGLLGRLGGVSSLRSPVILEIGAGYGGLAYHLKKLLPQARYVIVDLPESLIFSSIYLSTLVPDTGHVLVEMPQRITEEFDQPGFTYVPNHLAHALQDCGIRADLVINTLSMSEMLDSQVRAYCELIRMVIGPGGAFFEQNQDNRHQGLVSAENIVSTFFTARRRLSLPTGVVHGRPNVWTAEGSGNTQSRSR